jgi:7-carboxy-7-deazaguanine synthase
VTETLFVSEMFHSLQGEGPSQGYPCSFLRLAGCNLTCTWCDTEYSWNWTKYDVRKETSTHSVAEVAERFANSPRLVITGGEPLLQQKAIEHLLALLPAGLPVEVETNGTLVPSDALLKRVTQWNVAPKLAHSGEPEARRICATALESLRDSGRAWLKIVVESPQNMTQVTDVVNLISWPSERVYLMPQCRSPEELANHTPQVVHMAIDAGYKFTGRLHLQVWGGERGR